jgi:hypothetical protein
MPILLWLLTFSALAQAQLQGSLQEKGTRKPLSEVNVFLLPHKLKAVTDTRGNFSFSEVPSGTCQLIVNLSGYKKLERELSCGEVNSLTLYLERQSYTIFETTVTGKFNKRDDQSQSLTQEEFLKTPGTFGGDPVRAAQNLPGVAQSGAGAQIIVQGAAPEDTGYVINGHRVPLVFHFGGLSSVIIPEAVERVDLLPSGYGPEYSRAIGGIIGLTTKEPRKDRLRGMAFVDLLNAGGLLEGPIDEKSSFLVAGRYSYVGHVLKAVANQSDNFELTAAPTFYDFTAAYDREINQNNKFRVTMVASRDELDLVLNKTSSGDPGLRGSLYNRTEFFRVIPQLTTQLDSKTKMDHSLGLGRDSLLVNVGGQFLDVNTNVISHRSEVIREWSPRSRTFLGLDNQFNDSRFAVSLPSTYQLGGVRNPFSSGEERLVRNEDSQFLLAAYLRQELKPADDSRWTFLPNLRYEHFTVTSEHVVQPRLQLRYLWDPSLILRGSWGLYVQPPRPQETDSVYGNPAIRSPRSWHYTAGFNKDFRQGTNQGLELTNNYFYKQLQDLVIPSPRGNYNNSGTGEILGGEVQAKYRYQAWSGQLVYTYLHSTRTIPGFGTSPAEFDQTHNLNLIGSYQRELWTYSARFRFVTGNPYTPVLGGSYDADNDVHIPLRGALFSERFGAFNQLDIRIDRRFIYDKWILTAYLDVQNLYNAQNAQNIQYSYDFRQSQKVRGLPVLPTVGLKGEF